MVDVLSVPTPAIIDAPVAQTIAELNALRQDHIAQWVYREVGWARNDRDVYHQRRDKNPEHDIYYVHLYGFSKKGEAAAELQRMQREYRSFQAASVYGIGVPAHAEFYGVMSYGNLDRIDHVMVLNAAKGETLATILGGKAGTPEEKEYLQIAAAYEQSKAALLLNEEDRGNTGNLFVEKPFEPEPLFEHIDLEYAETKSFAQTAEQWFSKSLPKLLPKGKMLERGRLHDMLTDVQSNMQAIGKNALPFRQRLNQSIEIVKSTPHLSGLSL